jgi:hypothetical protein
LARKEVRVVGGGSSRSRRWCRGAGYRSFPSEFAWFAEAALQVFDQMLTRVQSSDFWNFPIGGVMVLRRDSNIFIWSRCVDLLKKLNGFGNLSYLRSHFENFQKRC